MTVPARPSPGPVLLRGLRRRCPHCGRGALFRRRVALYPQCAVCGLTYLRNQGDTWAFLLVVDRLFFILPVIAAIYFGLFSRPLTVLVPAFTGIALLFFVTMPHRFGVCVALDYLTRVYWGDPADRLPAAPGEDAPPGRCN